MNPTDNPTSADRMLRPTAAQALDAWRALVTAERIQVEALPNRPRPEDFYAPVAEHFRADPDRTDDASLNALLDLVRPDETWLDLGAGGGRYALAIARQAKQVYAVEPSEGMRAVLTDAAQQNGIANIQVFPERWPGPSVAPVADVAFISQVGYDVADIGPFLDQLEAHAQRLCAAVLFEQAPISYFASLWEPVHGEKRTLLPGMREFVNLLFARGAVPSLTWLTFEPQAFPDLDALHQAARRPIWALPDTEEDRKLGRAVRDLAVQTADGYTIGPSERHLGIATWSPQRPK